MARALQRRRDLSSGKIWASFLRPWLYLGAGRDAANLEQLRGHGITHILNVADDVENFYEKEFVYLRLDVADFGQDIGIGRCFQKARVFAEGVRGQGASGAAVKCLVHCANGSNRSATVAVALLMMMEDRTLEDAMREIKALRPSARPLKDNWEELKKLDAKLVARRGVV